MDGKWLRTVSWAVGAAATVACLLVGAPRVGAADAPAAAPAPAPAKANYVGAEANCRMCHSDIYNGWTKTPHARAFQDLENVGKSKDPACLSCHSTGFGEGGFKDEASTPNLKGIQCEACHGPGGDHNGDKSKIIGSPAAKTCAKCHLTLGIHG